MTHEITIRRDGTAEAAFACTPPWHGLGVVLDHPMTSAEALRAAQLDWAVDKFPVYVESNGRYVEIEDKKAIKRLDNDEVLGIVSKDYRVVNNTEAFQFLDSLVENEEMTYEAAFSLRGGRTVVLLARMPQVDYITDNDVCHRYILFSTTHDGTGAIRLGPTSVRVVCANTYSLAISSGEIREVDTRDFDSLRREFRITHKGNVDDKLRSVRRLLEFTNRKFDDYVDIARQLVNHKWTSEQFEQFLDVMCPPLNPMDPDYTERRAKAIEETRKDITNLYYHHPWQNDDVSVKQTAWAAFNSVVQHIDYLPRRGATFEQKAEARFNVALYGTGRDMKKRALVAALRVSGCA